MKIKDIISVIEELAPVSFQESYDNTGMQIGNNDKEINSVLLTLDVTEDTINEAIANKNDLIISHHPLIFSGIKKLSGRNSTERIVIKAIKNDIAIYSCHTNIDSAWNGVNVKLAEILGLHNVKILKPISGNLKKLITFVPTEHAEKLRTSLFEAGAGNIGNYDSCSYNTEGKGTYRANENANPFIGAINEYHTENEIRIETIFPSYLKSKVISALLSNHPYEEVAYDIYSLDNSYKKQGIGAIGTLEKEMNEEDFLKSIKNILNCKQIKHSALTEKKIKKVAVCGGSGSFLISDALSSGADAFITADLKYHQFQEPDNKMLLIDAGHFETEYHTLQIFYELLNKKFPTFAIYFSKVSTNPVNYL
jgi:dinuclear metal center YbgI/SA1388 family protein